MSMNNQSLTGYGNQNLNKSYERGQFSQNNQIPFNLEDRNEAVPRSAGRGRARILPAWMTRQNAEYLFTSKELTPKTAYNRYEETTPNTRYEETNVNSTPTPEASRERVVISSTRRYHSKSRSNRHSPHHRTRDRSPRRKSRSHTISDSRSRDRGKKHRQSARDSAVSIRHGIFSDTPEIISSELKLSSRYHVAPDRSNANQNYQRLFPGDHARDFTSSNQKFTPTDMNISQNTGGVKHMNIVSNVPHTNNLYSMGMMAPLSSPLTRGNRGQQSSVSRSFNGASRDYPPQNNGTVNPLPFQALHQIQYSREQNLETPGHGSQQHGLSAQPCLMNMSAPYMSHVSTAHPPNAVIGSEIGHTKNENYSLGQETRGSGW